MFSVRLISRYAFDWIEQLRYYRNELFDILRKGFSYELYQVGITYNEIKYMISGIDQMISSGLGRFTIILQLKIYHMFCDNPLLLSIC